MSSGHVNQLLVQKVGPVWFYFSPCVFTLQWTTEG